MHFDDENRALLEGDGSYGFSVIVDGDDLVVRGARATWFGGDFDPLDPGTTASGVVTKGHPDCMGCALPMDVGPRCPNTQGSPIPRLPWKTEVRVYNPKTHKTIVVPLIDIGPAKPPHAHAQIDLTIAAFEALGVNHHHGEQTVDYRIFEGAKYLPVVVIDAISAHAAAPQST